MSDSAAREETIFSIARQLSHPEDRAAYLKDACADDRALRERIERLLHAEWSADQFLARSALSRAGTGAERKTPVPGAGDVLEDYHTIEKIGGNMGLVYKARHRLLNKVVALKLLPAESI